MFEEKHRRPYDLSDLSRGASGGSKDELPSHSGRTQRHVWSGRPQHRAWSPPTDVYETEEYLLVRLEIAGMHEDAFDVTFHNGTLLISGTREEPDAPRRAYYQMEIRYGRFVTALGITHPIDVEAIEARYEAGFLTVTLPKRREADRRVEVQ
ncbi:MAG TPA: Hsp20/alpha crystallin family protein [Ardenticatenaceae bacterium]|nr:Hsp20/alpha crystallin family protein [Ardenticatenaceae bacterium]